MTEPQQKFDGKEEKKKLPNGMLFDLADIHDVCTSRSTTQTSRTDKCKCECKHNQQ